MSSLGTIRNRLFSTSTSTSDPVDTSDNDHGPVKCWEYVGDEIVNIDNVFGVLSNERRRMVIHIVSERDETVTLSDLAEEIAAYENECPPAKVSSGQRKRVYVGLYQCHVEKIDAAGIVEWDDRSGEINPTPLTDVVSDYANDGYECEHFSDGREGVEVRRL